MKIILIGNYPLDRQESMERFAQMLYSGFSGAGVEVELWRPRVILGTWFNSSLSGLGKWVGYLDKWVLFPLLLRWRQLGLKRTDVRFHVCDHSNSPYLFHLPAETTIITCHDVLAIRGALGHADAYCPASGFGKILQKWIMFHLSRARRVGCVSQLTLDQLKALAPQKPPKSDWRVVHNAFNAKFGPMDPEDCLALVEKAGLKINRPFILHVGSGLPRKNRKVILDAVHALGNRWQGVICFAGQGLDEKLMDHARSLGIEGRVVSVYKPDHATLVALYNLCEVFIFPSFSEGFGWPIIEAQACGAPVIASNVPPLPEVSGGMAFHAHPDKPAEFAEAVLALQDEATRKKTISEGFKNCTRFEPTHMIDAYLDLHGLKRVQLSESCF
ncbi:glycosyltransferase family 4 protein [Larkinella sp. VNQ87]|uniref:glycosyltransferase family 4 protein n=1 Tax=Larkinella sp. VNQ87 TaxID=3400921 RepID=UPI003BFFCA65